MVNVAVIGAGYVGITSAACFAHLGHTVRCADIDAERVKRLRKGDLPILEDRLPVLVSEGLESGRLEFVVGAAEAVIGAEVVLLCVATPTTESGAADLSYLDAAVEEIAPLLDPDTVVITKSTVPVGTTRRVQQMLDERGGAEKGVRVASNPEFLSEGSAVRDFLKPDRIVIGCDDPSVAVRITDLYRGIEAPVVVTNAASAELIKYASNSYLAARVSFVNAIANLAEAVGADMRDVALGMGFDVRIGPRYLQPGPGYGGSCLPKDVAALLHTASEAGVDLAPLRAAQDVNVAQREVVLAKITGALERPIAASHIAVLGLTFKANTDDLRDSPALDIATTLAGMGAQVRAFDPVAGEAVERLHPEIEIAYDAYEACEDADVVVVATEWDEFRWIDLSRVRTAMRGSHVVDARNLLDAARVRQQGLSYTGVGR